MMTLKTEKRLMQAAIALGCLVPLTVGLTGMVRGAAFLDGGSVDMDSHFRYLSGLLFGIGVGFVTAIPKIELYTQRVRIMTFMVVIGGFARLVGLLVSGVPHEGMVLALVMELVATPVLCVWQNRLAKRFMTQPS